MQRDRRGPGAGAADRFASGRVEAEEINPMNRHDVMIATVAFALTAGPPAWGARIAVGTATGHPGERVAVETYAYGGDVAYVRNTIRYDARTRVVARADRRPLCAELEEPPPGNGIHQVGFSFGPAGCLLGIDCDTVGAVYLTIFALDPVPDGFPLFSCTVQIAADARPGRYPLRCEYATAADLDGNEIPTTCDDGAIIVPCSGDCDQTGRVDIDDLVVMTNVALGERPLDDCSSGDIDGDGTIRIGELVRAVRYALDGCDSGLDQQGAAGQ